MKEILGKKIGMTRIFKDTGESVPVTVIEAGPCPVIAVRTKEKHGYEAYQVGFGKALRARRDEGKRRKTRDSESNKPLAGQYAKAGVDPRQYLREVRFDGEELKVGDAIKVDIFKEGDLVDVTGVSRGLGFSGSMKRHHFSGANKTHGQSDRWRAPGSIGQSSYPSRVYKGMRMAGRMGRERVTTLKLQVVQIIADENLMLIKGAVPGIRGSLVKVRTSNRSK